jgi:hypothetical protein
MKINKRHDQFSSLMLFHTACFFCLKEKEKMWANTSWLDCCCWVGQHVWLRCVLIVSKSNPLAPQLIAHCTLQKLHIVLWLQFFSVPVGSAVESKTQQSPFFCWIGNLVGLIALLLLQWNTLFHFTSKISNNR